MSLRSATSTNTRCIGHIDRLCSSAVPEPASVAPTELAFHLWHGHGEVATDVRWG